MFVNLNKSLPFSFKFSLLYSTRCEAADQVRKRLCPIPLNEIGTCKNINNDENKRKTFENIIYDINCIIKDNAESFKQDSYFSHFLKEEDITYT